MNEEELKRNVALTEYAVKDLNEGQPWLPLPTRMTGSTAKFFVSPPWPQPCTTGCDWEFLDANHVHYRWF